MLTFEQIKELIELVAEHRLNGIELERSGFRFRIDGQKAVEHLAITTHPASPSAAAHEVQPGSPAAVPAATPKGPAAEEASDSSLDDVHMLPSPIVGTFYRAPSPDSSPFVETGDRVKKGQVLCIVEAMKLMNEIESDVDGVVTKIYPKNAQPVEYGEPLFAIKTG